MFDCGSVRVFVLQAVLRFARIAAAEISPTTGEDGKNHPSGSDSPVGGKKEKKCRKGIRIYFAN